MKYNEKIVKEISAWVRENGLMAYGGAKLMDFLAHFRIDDKTYYRWLKVYPEFKQALDEAKQAFKQGLSREIAKSLAMAAKGYEREETEIEYVPNKEDDDKPKIKRQRVKTIYVQPNVAAGIFLLTNLDPEHYQNKQNMNVGGKLDAKIEIGMVEAGIEPASSEDEVDV